MRFVDKPRCHSQRAGLGDLVEIYAATPPWVAEERADVFPLSFRRPGVRFILREPSPLLEGNNVEKQILPKEIVAIIFWILTALSMVYTDITERVSQMQHPHHKNPTSLELVEKMWKTDSTQTDCCVHLWICHKISKVHPGIAERASKRGHPHHITQNLPSAHGTNV